MSPKMSFPVLFALAWLLAVPTGAAASKRVAACPAGQVKISGACFDACPTDGRFDAPDACQCPAGFGKILLGDGGGECRRLTCRTDAAVDPVLCDCPSGKVAKPAGKGRVRCEAQAAPAKAR